MEEKNACRRHGFSIPKSTVDNIVKKTVKKREYLALSRKIAPNMYLRTKEILRILQR